MKVKYIQMIGIAAAAAYGVFIVFLYTAEPRSLADVPRAAKTALQDAVSAGQAAVGAYEVNKAEFAAGVDAFRRNDFIAARDRFEKADPQKRDAGTQFYIAYSYYRQGWGRVSNDDALFRQALAALDRVNAIDPAFRSDDADLKLRTAAELRAELEEGLKFTADDLNPFRLVRERK